MEESKVEIYSRIAVFAAVILILTLMSLLWPDKGFSETENRYLQQRPRLTLDSLVSGAFTSKYDTYLSDQFPLRDRWVELKTSADILQLRKDSNRVYFGKDGYLVEKFDVGDIDPVLLGKNQERLIQFVEKYETLLGTGRVKVMLIPSAAQILKEKLPAFAPTYDQAGIYGPLQERLGTDRVLSLEPVFREHKEEYIFYKTDHHWTVDGAYEGYRAWTQSMGAQPWDKDQFMVELLASDFYGTVQAKVGTKVQPDRMYRYLPQAPMSYRVRYDLAEETEESLYELSALETRDKYTVYLDGNHALTEIETKSEDPAFDGAGRRLLIVKDSFAHSFAPFAANHFEKTVMVDLRYYNGSIEELAKQENITDVLVLYQAVNFAGDINLSKIIR